MCRCEVEGCVDEYKNGRKKVRTVMQPSMWSLDYRFQVINQLINKLRTKLYSIVQLKLVFSSKSSCFGRAPWRGGGGGGGVDLYCTLWRW